VIDIGIFISWRVSFSRGDFLVGDKKVAIGHRTISLFWSKDFLVNVEAIDTKKYKWNDKIIKVTGGTELATGKIRYILKLLTFGNF
jgi:hypothetical protein